MESAYGRSFSHVRVHTDTTATALSGGLNARAFTVGEHIAFDSGEYQPGSLIGDAIIAHELAHVMQQGSASNVIAPVQIGQDSYDQFEEDADQSAVAAAISLWGRTKRVLNGITQNFKPRLKSGLQLQACSRTVRQCPRGLRWAVVGEPTATGPVCVCAWRCLPPGVGFSLSSGSGGSSGPTISCANKDRFGRCPGEPNYETVDEDYERRANGTVVGVGAHMSPLGEQAACGCLPLDIEGDPTGQQQVHAPLLPPGLDITNVVGPLAEVGAGRRVANPRTGVREPAPVEQTRRPSAPMTPPPSHVGAPPEPAPVPGTARPTPAPTTGGRPAGGGGRPPVPPPPTPAPTRPAPAGTTPAPPEPAPVPGAARPTPAPGAAPPTPAAPAAAPPTPAPVGTTPAAPGTTPAPAGTPPPTPAPTTPAPAGTTPRPAGTTPAAPGTTPAPTTTGPTPVGPGLQPPTRAPGQGISVPGRVSWGNPASRPAYGHSQSEHGARRPTRELQDRANDPNKGPQGQFYDDNFIVEAEQRAPLTPGPHDVPMGRPVGRVYMPNASPIENMTTVRVVRKPDLTVRISFPIN